MRKWQIQEAKTNFSELLRKAEREGPQEITRHGQPVAVVLSHRAYDRLSGSEQSLVEFIRRSPLYGVEEVDLSRDHSGTRDVEL